MMDHSGMAGAHFEPVHVLEQQFWLIMEDGYLAEITQLLKQACPELAVRHQLEFKRVFGAVGGYVNGRIFASCGQFGFALRLPRASLDELFTGDDVKHLKYFAKGHVKKEYAVLPKRVLKNGPQLEKLIDESVKYALSL